MNDSIKSFSITLVLMNFGTSIMYICTCFRTCLAFTSLSSWFAAQKLDI